jgi:hypothetical protein
MKRHDDASDSDRRPVPAPYDGAESPAESVSLTIDVDGERFTVRRAAAGGWDYDWLSGPNEGYGFSTGGPPNQSQAEHQQSIRWFLADIDPATGYMGDDSGQTHLRQHLQPRSEAPHLRCYPAGWS